MPDREGAQQLKKNCSNKLHVVPIDVTDDWQVRGAVKYVKEHIGDNGKISGMNLFNMHEFVFLQFNLYSGAFK